MLTSMCSAEEPAEETPAAAKRARVTRGNAAREAEEQAREAEAAKEAHKPSRKSARLSSVSTAA